MSNSVTPAAAIPAGWANDEVLDGLDILDKQALIGNMFRIIGCVFQTNKDNVSICYIDGEDANGYEFTFTDSSTGVRAQIVGFLTNKGLDAAIDTGEYVDFKLVVPNGLRVSEYDIPQRGPNGQPIPGRTRVGKTYYLTSNGKRRADSKAVESKPVRKPRAAS